MPRDRTETLMPSIPNRTRKGLGKDVLAGIDGRTGPARRFREIVAQMASDLGGDPSQGQAAIMERAATLIVWCEGEEAARARGESFDIASFTTATNALRRLLVDLGLERKARDVTPADLTTYLKKASG